MRRTLLISVALSGVAVTIAACSSTSTQHAVYDAASVLTIADKAALVYTSQPRCPPGKSGLGCSDQATVDKIKAAAQQAHDAVKAAEADPSSAGIASAAIAALVALIPTH